MTAPHSDRDHSGDPFALPFWPPAHRHAVETGQRPVNAESATSRVVALARHIAATHAELPEPHGPFTKGYDVAIRDVLRILSPRCWCGGAVGNRLPADVFGLGCLADINHVWTGDVQ